MDPVLIEAIQKEAKRKAEAKAMAQAVEDIPSKPAAAVTAPVPASDDKPLPPNWKQASDPSTGKTYYYNKKSKETRWTRPEE
jgi:hypothetical protein